MNESRAISQRSARAFSALAFLAFTLFASACLSTSRSPQDDVQYWTRGGDVALVLADGRERSGELLAVDDSSFVILDQRRVVVASRAAVYRVEFGLTRIDLPGNGLSAKDRETLKRRSRFPYGMSATALNALLVDSGQLEPEVLSAGRP